MRAAARPLALSPSGVVQEKSLPRSAFVGQRRVGLGVAIT